MAGAGGFEETQEDAGSKVVNICHWQ